jgi:hypothetical protein
MQSFEFQLNWEAFRGLQGFRCIAKAKYRELRPQSKADIDCSAQDSCPNAAVG